VDAEGEAVDVRCELGGEVGLGRRVHLGRMADVAAGLDPTDLKTETLTNARGGAVVRVTHLPTSLVAERARSAELDSPVQAQRECVDELVGRVEAAGAAGASTTAAEARSAGVVSRAEFDALVARVAELERLVERD
jgi:isopentenyl diphosphate isomerase/L-lactate dehydrogenase-like FMN-dependent dehydrogenase